MSARVLCVHSIEKRREKTGIELHKLSNLTKISRKKTVNDSFVQTNNDFNELLSIIYRTCFLLLLFFFWFFNVVADIFLSELKI